MFQFHFLNCSQITLISSPRWRRTWLRRAGWAAGRGGPAPRSSRWRWRGWGRAWGTPQGPRPPPSCSSHPDWPSSLKYSSSNNLIMTLFSTGTAVLSTLCCCCVAWSLELCLVLNSRSRQGRRRLLPSITHPAPAGIWIILIHKFKLKTQFYFFLLLNEHLNIWWWKEVVVCLLLKVLFTFSQSGFKIAEDVMRDCNMQ